MAAGPSAEAALVSILTSGSPNPVAALVGTRVYALQLPQNPTFPAMVYTRISTPRSQYRTLDGRANYASPRFQLDCWATDFGVVMELGQAVYGLLEGYAGISAGLSVDYISTDDEAAEVEVDAGPDGKDLYRKRLDVFLAHPE